MTLLALNANGGWAPRNDRDLATYLSRLYGFPVDIGSRRAGLTVVAAALQTGDIAKAQIAALHLQLPEPINALVRRLYAMLPRLRVTELFAEVHGWTDFADRFAHLRTGAPPDDARVLMTAVLADATNLGLTRMARSVGAFSHSRLLWVAEWHVREETYRAALACLSDAIHAQPFTSLWGDGDTSSDGQFFRAGGHGQARADYNAKYGSDPGVKFYTHVSDRYAPFHPRSSPPTRARPRMSWRAMLSGSRPTMGFSVRKRLGG